MGARCDFAGGPLCACVHVCGHRLQRIRTRVHLRTGDEVYRRRRDLPIMCIPRGPSAGSLPSSQLVSEFKYVPPAAVDGRCVGGQH